MKLWEEYGENLHRMEVDGGYLYNSVKGLVFVPACKTIKNIEISVGDSEITILTDGVTARDGIIYIKSTPEYARALGHNLMALADQACLKC